MYRQLRFERIGGGALSLHKDTPLGRAVQRYGNIAVTPVLSGLHHRYARTPDLPLWARSATVLHQPLIELDDVKWRLAGQGATTVLNCAAQADIVRAAALCRVVR